MVAHFVHKSSDGALGVVAVLLQPGAPNKAFEPVFAHLPRPGEKITVEGLQLDLSGLLPKALGYYAFEGSLTTPPCSEGVNWMVLKQPVTLSPGPDQGLPPAVPRQCTAGAAAARPRGAREPVIEPAARRREFRRAIGRV
jgi:carbonic anhydrase